MSEKISVIVPVYNAEKFLTRCVESILNQTYSNLELILVNDGSKDNSLALCREYEAKDSRVVVLDKPNGGAASARNRGLDYVTGDYIGFCDADDYLDTDMYETLLSVLTEYNLDMVDSLSKVYDNTGKMLYRDDDSRTLNIVSSTDYIKSIFLRKGNVSLCTRLFRREFIENIRITEGKRVEDFYFIIECLIKTDRCATYKYPFYNYVTNPESVTHKATGSIYLDALYFYDLAVKLLGERSSCMRDEQTYYLLKMYYLLAISITADENKKYEKELKLCKKNLLKHKKIIRKNPYLINKEKLVLQVSCISMRFARLLFCLKNGGKK